MATYQWTIKRRNYKLEKNHLQINGVQVQNHPLIWSKSDVNRELKQAPVQKKINKVYYDPLSSALEGSDPLSQFVACEGIANEIIKSKNEEIKGSPNSKNWIQQRLSILNKFTTSEKLSITSSFLEGGEKLIVKHHTGSVNDKLKHRLQQLDEYEDQVSEHKGLSQEDYIRRITQLSEELQQAWKVDQRVKALKIVIQCSKLLLETHPLAFYPSKFVIITDILDNFGQLVFQRIADKGDIRLENNELPANFKPDLVSEVARETCRNWMYKIASIRELLPRLYVEMAVLKSYSFLNINEFSETLIRLSRAVRGIGNPLVAAYARCYLTRVGRETTLKGKSFIEENISDFLLSYPQLFTPSIRNEMAEHKIEFSQYLALYSPALDWMFLVLTEQNNINIQNLLFEQCLQLPNPGLLLLSMIQTFSPEFVSQRVLELVHSITNNCSAGIPSHQLLRHLGLTVSLSRSEDGSQSKVLSTVWRNLSRLQDVGDYLPCVEAWIPYIVRRFGNNEINVILSDIIMHLSPKAPLKHVGHLNNIVQALINAECTDFTFLFTTDKFTTFLDMYPDGFAKANVCKMVLKQFLLVYHSTISNSVMVDRIVHLARILHGTLNAMSVEDEKRQISEIVIQFIDLVDFGRDFQQMLSFYGDARASFTNLDAVMAHLVQCVNRLSMRTRQIIVNHNKRTSSFVRACGAFVYITIPAMTCPLTRFNLYLLSGQVALANQCLGQADACFEGAIHVINEMSPTDEAIMTSSVCNLLSALLAQPDSPGTNRMNLLRRLLRTVRSYSTTHNLQKLRIAIYLDALRLLSAYAQSDYIYHIPNVEANDRLYMGDEDFQMQINDHCSALLNELLNDLKNLGNHHQYRQQAALSLDLFSLLVSTADLQDNNLKQLSLNLFHLAQKHGEWDLDYAIRLVDYIHQRALSHDDVFTNLASSLRISV